MWRLTVTKVLIYTDHTNEHAKRMGNGMETKPRVKVKLNFTMDNPLLLAVDTFCKIIA